MEADFKGFVLYFLKPTFTKSRRTVLSFVQRISPAALIAKTIYFSKVLQSFYSSVVPTTVLT